MKGGYNFAKMYSSIVDVWNPFMKELNNLENKFGKKFNRSIKTLQGHFLEVASELWVAKELQERHHEVRVEYKKKHADLYIGSIGVEVKGSTRKYIGEGIPRWGYNLGKYSQLYERDYQILILVRADENSIPFDSFVITMEELKMMPPYKHKKTEVHYIEVEENYDDYKASIAIEQVEETEIEKKLHLQSDDFRNNWDKILKLLK